MLRGFSLNAWSLRSRAGKHPRWKEYLLILSYGRICFFYINTYQFLLYKILSFFLINGKLPPPTFFWFMGKCHLVTGSCWHLSTPSAATFAPAPKVFQAPPAKRWCCVGLWQDLEELRKGNHQRSKLLPSWHSFFHHLLLHLFFSYSCSSWKSCQTLHCQASFASHQSQSGHQAGDVASHPSIHQPKKVQAVTGAL